ncbi:hypothetical protein AC230_01320 [Streptomyces caatingaensis]|uniref:SseB protein N-terminal domain-containing protein n=1 Tax=Streptomyces caatingaensis TaxID=1678637 RepID=A0A0K9XLA7_9ACTN|nr:hypothetical protein AC230_01320 [Streptomyces caatingaensis]
MYAGRAEPLEALGQFRRSPVLVPLDARGGLWTAAYEGVWWIHAFSDEAALARFMAGRADGRDVEYVTVLGARLLDVVVPAVGEPVGVALDVGGDTPFLLPPVVGVVPDVAAVNAGREADR